MWIIMLNLQISLLLCLILTADQVFSKNEVTYKTIAADNVPPESKVVLKPPSKLDTFFTSATTIYLVWDSPKVYQLHDVDANDTSWMDDNSTSWDDADNNSAPEMSKDGSNSSSTEATISGTTYTHVVIMNKTITSASSKGDNSTVLTIRNICRPYGYLFNRTVEGDYMGATSTSKDGGHVHVQSIHPESPEDNSTTSITITVNQALVPFSKGCVEEYIVYVYDNTTGKIVQLKKLRGDQPTEINITDLEASTSYRLLIAAEFTSGHKLNSTSLVVKTKDKIEKNECACQRSGTIGGQRSCSAESSCICKPGYSGLYCEVCQAGFYKTAMFFPCHPCPCASHSSVVRSCHFVEGFLVCDKCRTGYTGNLCHQCSNGFYRYKGKYCVPCRCHGNTDPKSRLICDPYSGACNSCYKNTTGFNCERCRMGYKGDAILYRNCTSESDINTAGVLPLPTGYIAGIVLAVILFLCFIVGLIVYKRWKYPIMKPFWTVELKEDHEGVNFSAVEDQEFLKTTERNQEGEFYEKQGGRGMKYAQLKEDV